MDYNDDTDGGWVPMDDGRWAMEVADEDDSASEPENEKDIDSDNDCGRLIFSKR